MKKLFGIVLILLFVSGAWWVSSRPEISLEGQEQQEELDEIYADKFSGEDRSEEILTQDYEKLVVNLKKENISGKEWEVVKNFSVKPEAAVTKENAKEFLSMAQKNLPDLYDCLKKDFCGMTTRGDHDPYFDEERTPAHFYINRNLLLLKESLKKSDELKTEIDWELLYDLATSESELVQVEALEIIKKYDESYKDKSELLKVTQNYKGTAKSDALVRLSKNASDLDKKAIVEDIKEVFAMSDAHTAMSVLEKLGEMKLSSSQLEDVLKNLCRFKETHEHNWPMIRFEAKEIFPKFEELCN